MFERPLVETLADRMNEPRKFIQVLIGPRQADECALVGITCNEAACEHSCETEFFEL